jgi:predicted nucleic acid-binding protein
MRKPKRYIDTSVISHLCHDDTPDKKADTELLWEQIKQGRYEVFISDVTVDEINQCAEPLKSTFNNFIYDIEHILQPITPEVESLAERIIEEGILTRKSIDDCHHIAAAITSGCDIIVSWNIKHLVNVRTINGVRGISLLEGYKTIDIYTPTILIGADSDDPRHS